MTGGSSFFGSPDGSNDGNFSRSDSNDFTQSLEHPSDQRLDLDCSSAQPVFGREKWESQSTHPCLAADSTAIPGTYQDACGTPHVTQPDISRPTKAPWLPVELLHDIFQYLHPVDFNAARHVCRRWMLASLSSHMLCKMLRRAGWSSFARGNTIDEIDGFPDDTESELRFSSALARVCGLGPDWTGSGVSFSWEGALPTIYSSPRKSLLVETCDVDFTELASGSQESTRSGASGLFFTVSACGRFLMVTDANMIFAYQLGPGYDIELVARISCPRRVIGVSMDTTCGRYAVAAFLDGRVGMVCDLQLCQPTAPSLPEEMCDNLSRHSTHCPILHDGEDSDESIYSHESRSSSPLALISAEDSSRRKRTISVAANEIPLTENQDIYQETRRERQDIKSQLCSSKRACKSSDDSVCPTLIPDKRTIYYDLCYPDDQPRSVAICPSRSCAAFGCNAGIQLHWIDVVTKRQEDRFFPLSATTDVLYFLPPRAGIDAPPTGTSQVTNIQSGPEARRLRLIGSAVSPRSNLLTVRTELSRRMFGAKGTGLQYRPAHQTYWPGLFTRELASAQTKKSSRKKSSHERLQQDWSLAELEGSIKQKVHGGPSSLPQHGQYDHDSSLADLWRKWASGYRHDKKPMRSNFDHYRAVPLSDGHHILFTDPPTGLLCLGCDAPFERPMKLIRKIVLEPPFWQGRTTSTEQIWQKPVDSKADREKPRGKRASSSNPPRHSEEEGIGPQHVRDDSDVLLFPTIYTAGKSLENGVVIVAGYEEDLVLFTIPPDVFAISQNELQPIKDDKHEAEDDASAVSTSGRTPLEKPLQSTSVSKSRENTMEWLDYWPDSVSWSTAASFAGVYNNDTGSSPDDPGFLNSPPLTGHPKPGIWPLKIRGTWLGRVPSLVDIAVRNEDGQLVVWAFGADGHAHVLEIDSVRVESKGHIPLRRKFVTQVGEVVDADYDDALWHVEENGSLGFDGRPPDIIHQCPWKADGKQGQRRVDRACEHLSQQMAGTDGIGGALFHRRQQSEEINLTKDASNGSSLAPSFNEGSSVSNARSDPSYSSPVQQTLPSDLFRYTTTLPKSALHLTHEFRHANAHAWQTDFDEVPYEMLMGNGDPSDVGHWAGYHSGRLASFRPEPTTTVLESAGSSLGSPRSRGYRSSNVNWASNTD